MMHNCSSQEHVISRKAKEKGISSDVIHSYFDEKIEEISIEYPNHTSNWRLGRAEYLLWEHFFSGESFPGKMENAKPNITHNPQNGDSREISKAVPNGTITKFNLQTDTTKETFKSVPSGPKSFAPVGTLKASAASVNDTKTDNIPRIPYKSQAELMKSTAASLGLLQADLDALYDEKIKIANSRFSSETDGWRMWFAESMVWGKFLKDTPFPGKEPARLYLLQSSNGTSQSLAEIDWQDVDRNPSIPAKSSSRMSDETYTKRPSGACQDNQQKSGRDSWAARMSRASRPDGPNHSLSGKDSWRPEISNAKKDPWRPGMSSTSRVSSVNASQNVSHSNAPSSGPAAYVQHQEKNMEKKATALGIRREFFQYLQKQRDLVRAEHPGCDSVIKHYLADSMVWAKFFSDEPFPGVEPVRGHSSACKARTRDTKSTLKKDRANHQPVPVYSELPAKNVSVQSCPDVPSNHPSAPTHSELPPKCTPSPPEVLPNQQLDTPHSGLPHKDWTQSPPVILPNQQLVLAHSGSPAGQEFLELPFQNPEEQWDTYIEEFNATEVDRLVIEESAKAEGAFRMVFDEETSQVISLEEFARRTRYRFFDTTLNYLGWGPGKNLGDGPQGLSNPADPEMVSGKRKQEDVDGDHGEQTQKRMCN